MGLTTQRAGPSGADGYLIIGESRSLKPRDADVQLDVGAAALAVRGRRRRNSRAHKHLAVVYARGTPASVATADPLYRGVHRFALPIRGTH